MFGPYTPLQQLDLLADYGTKSYVVGSTNSLLLQQKDRYSDILINVRAITQTCFHSDCLPLTQWFRWSSLMKTLLISPLLPYGVRSPSQLPTDAGSTC